MLKVFSFLMMFLVVSGCSEKREAPLYRLTLSDTALNGINKKTPFSYQAIAPLLIGFDIKTYKTVAANSSLIFRVYYHDVEWFQILPTADKKHIKSIYVFNKNVVHKCKIKSEEKCEDSKSLHYFYSKTDTLEGIELFLNN